MKTLLTALVLIFFTEVPQASTNTDDQNQYFQDLFMDCIQYGNNALTNRKIDYCFASAALEIKRQFPDWKVPNPNPSPICMDSDIYHPTPCK